MKRFLAALVVGMILVPTTAHSAPILNYPNGTVTQQHVLFDTYLHDINAAPQGAVIRLANPAMSWPIAHALLAAHTRGVDVRVVEHGGGVQGRGISPPVQRLIDRLGTDVHSSSFLHLCMTGCNSGRSGMHAKTMMVSNVGGHPVTFVTSVDLLSPIYTKEFDTGYSIDSATVYRHHVAWFDSMLDDRHNVTSDYAADGLVVSTFPRPASTVNDNWYLDYLAPVRCKASTAGRMVAGRTRLTFATSLWSPLLASIAHRLVDLNRQGCTVQVILNRDKTPRSIVRILRRNRVPYRYSNADGHHSHVKEIGVAGWYAGRWVHTVVVGSTNPSIMEMKYDDDEMVRAIDSQSVYDAFNRQFQTIWNLGNTRPLASSRSVIITR